MIFFMLDTCRFGLQYIVTIYTHILNTIMSKIVSSEHHFPSIMIKITILNDFFLYVFSLVLVFSLGSNFLALHCIVVFFFTLIFPKRCQQVMWSYQLNWTERPSKIKHKVTSCCHHISLLSTFEAHAALSITEKITWKLPQLL